jgi:hypothetical protein
LAAALSDGRRAAAAAALNAGDAELLLLLGKAEREVKIS